MIMGDEKEVVLYYKAAIGSNELIWIKWIPYKVAWKIKGSRGINQIKSKKKKKLQNLVENIDTKKTDVNGVILSEESHYSYIGNNFKILYLKILYN